MKRLLNNSDNIENIFDICMSLFIPLITFMLLFGM